MQGTDLHGADLTGAYLDGDDPHRGDLMGASLSHAIPAEADLSAAFLHRADLRGANLIGTKLQKAHLFLANLSHARFDEDTTLPDATKWIPDGMVRELGNTLLTRATMNRSATKQRRINPALVRHIKLHLWSIAV